MQVIHVMYSLFISQDEICLLKKAFSSLSNKQVIHQVDLHKIVRPARFFSFLFPFLYEERLKTK